MVFAAAVSVKDTGYALTGTEIAGDIRAGLTRTTGTSTGQCQ